MQGVVDGTIPGPATSGRKEAGMSASIDTDSPASPGQAMAVPQRSPLYLAWLLLLMLATYTLNFADRQILVILIEPIKKEFGVSDAMMGALTGLAFTLLYVGLSIPAARLADQWSRVNVLCLSAAAWSAFTALSGFAAQFWHLAVARVGVGIGEAGGLPPTQSILSAYFPVQWRATALSILGAGGNLGSFVGLYGGALVNESHGWRMAFIALGIPGIILAVLIWLTVPEPPRAKIPPQQASIWQVIGLCLQSRSITLASFGCGIGTIAAYGLLTWLPSFFIRVHGVAPVTASLLMGVGGSVGGILGGVVGGRLVDRLAQKSPALQLSIPALGFALCFPVQLGMLLWPESHYFMLGPHHVPLAALLVPVNTFFFSFWLGPTYAMAQSLVPESMRSQATAFVLLIYILLGQGLGPFLTGVLSDLFHASANVQSLRYALLTVLPTSLVAAGLYYLASRRYPAERAARAALAGG